MRGFNLVIFGFTSNLAQLKIIPALYDLEEKNLLSVNTKIIGVGRKNLLVNEYINQVLHSESRHHKHTIKKIAENKLIKRTVYWQEDFEKGDDLYQKLKEIKGNTLYYLATYPELYANIFESLKSYNLNKSNNGWVRIVIEKPIGGSLSSAQNLENLLSKYFTHDQIFRVDHYLGKESLRKIFGSSINPQDVKKIEATVSENFGIGKRGVYYDSIGALIDMGQNHLLQMLASLVSKSVSPADRAKVLESLRPDSENIVFGQYEGYLKEESVKAGSKTETFFALKTFLNLDPWKDIPIYLSSGKMLDRDLAKVSVFMKDDSKTEFVISPLKKEEEFDPYERVIMDSAKGDATFFNSKEEVMASWKFIDPLTKNKKIFIYKKGSNITDLLSTKIS